jgi:hypothetical protein
MATIAWKVVGKPKKNRRWNGRRNEKRGLLYHRVETFCRPFNALLGGRGRRRRRRREGWGRANDKEKEGEHCWQSFRL